MKGKSYRSIKGLSNNK